MENLFNILEFYLEKIYNFLNLKFLVYHELNQCFQNIFENFR